MVGCMLLTVSCTTVLVTSEPVYEWYAPSQTRTLVVAQSYPGDHRAVLRLEPKVDSTVMRVRRRVARRFSSPSDVPNHLAVSAIGAWLVSIQAGPLLYLVTGYLDFLALGAILPAVAVVSQVRWPMGTVVECDTTTNIRWRVPSRLSVTAEGESERPAEYEVRGGAVDLYLTDLDGPGLPTEGVVLRVSALEASNEVRIHVARADIARARDAESKALRLWSTVRDLERTERYAEACSVCCILLRDFRSTALVARDSHVAKHLDRIVKAEADLVQAARYPLPRLLENARKGSAPELLAVLDLDVLSYFNLTQYDTDLKRSVFKKSDEYAKRLAELKALRLGVLATPHYVEVARGDQIGDYDTKRKGFTIDLGSNMGILAYDPRAPKSVSGVLFPALPTRMRSWQKAGLDVPGVYSEELLLSMTEEQGLAVEQNRGNVVIYIFFRPADTKTVTFKFRGITMAGGDLGLREVRQRVVVGDSVRLVVGNTGTGEVYFDRRY